MTELLVFSIAGGGLVLSALAVILAKSPLRGALYLIASLLCLSVLFMALEASFVAAMQILVYAGAIMVLFVFVIMLLNLGPDAAMRPAYLSISKLLGSGAVLFLAYRAGRGALEFAAAPRGPLDGSVAAVGARLLTDYLFGFEAISLLLLVAVVGAVVLGMRRLT